MIIQHRRGATADWKQADMLADQLPAVILKDGEFAIETFEDGSRRVKIGDGHTKFRDLPYVDEYTDNINESRLREVEKNFTQKLLSSSAGQNELIATVHNNLSQKITESATELIALFDGKLEEQANNTETIIKEKTKELDDKLTNSITASNVELKKLVDTLDKQHDSDVRSIKNTLTTTTAKLSDEVSSLTNKQKADNAAVLTALTKQEAASSQADADIIAVLQEYVKKINAELADLVDDDILILEKTFSVENTLTAELRALKTKLTAVGDKVDSLHPESLSEAEARLMTVINDLASQCLQYSYTDEKAYVGDDRDNCVIFDCGTANDL